MPERGFKKKNGAAGTYWGVALLLSCPAPTVKSIIRSGKGGLIKKKFVEAENISEG